LEHWRSISGRTKGKRQKEKEKEETFSLLRYANVVLQVASRRERVIHAQPFGLLLAFFFLPFAFLLFPFAVAAQDTPADNWSQFRGNHSLTGVSQSTLANNLKLLWTYEAGDSIESSAVIVGRTVFVGSQKGELVSLNLDNGKVYWKFSTGAPVGESSPAYSAGVVYIGDSAGWLNALNASNGQKLWAFKTGSEIKSSPVVVGDRVLIGSYDQHLYCLSARNGSVLWKVRTDGPVHATPSIYGGMAFITGCDEVFRAIRISDGAQVFQIASGAYTGASPALSGGAAFYGTFNNDVLMVDLAQRRIAWRYQHPSRKFRTTHQPP